MVNISENELSVSIEIPKQLDNVYLDMVYTKEYFSQLNLDVIDNNNLIGGYKRLGGSLFGILPENSSDLMTTSLAVPNFTNESGLFIRMNIKKRSGKTVTLSNYLKSFSNKLKSANRFASGMDYNEVESIVKDVFIQLRYIDFLGLKMITLLPMNIYRINDRFVVIEENSITKKEYKDDIEFKLNIQKLIMELIGEKYEKGRCLEKLKCVEGTRLYKLLQRMEYGEMHTW